MCLPCASSPSHPRGCWVLPTGLPNLPAGSPALPGGAATWTRPDSLSQPHLRGATGPALCSHPRPRPAPTWTTIAGPGETRPAHGVAGGQWPGSWAQPWLAGGGGEARDQGLQQGTRLKEVDCSRSPDLFPHSPCPSSQHRHHGTSTSGRSKGCPVRGGEVSPGGSSAAAESKPPGWPDVRASAGGHQWGQRVSRPLGVGAEEEGEPGQRPGEAPKPCCWAAGRLAGWRGQKAWAGRGDRARLGLDGAAGLAWAPRRRGKGEASELRASAKRGADALGRSVGRQAERKKKGFPDRESNPGRGGESAES